MHEANDRRDGFLDPLSLLREGSDREIAFTSPEEASKAVKQAAHAVGADLVGIAKYDSRWTYTESFSMSNLGGKPNLIPSESVKHVIVIGQAMDTKLVDTAPSALSGSATGMGYSLDALVLLTVSQFIRNLGYQAIPSMNDTARQSRML